MKRGDLETLFENDQLNLQMVAGLAFPYYSEARITFMPTYKYDVGTDTFDTSYVLHPIVLKSPVLTSTYSEKARIPAWTDRILRKGSNLRQLAYNSAPLRFSDHRPVYAIFECTVSIVNEKRRDKISREIYERRKAEVGGDAATLISHETDDEDLIGYDAIEPGLPPASSDRQKWWLESGKMARSSISPPKPEHPGSQTILNPKRPTNPHVPTDEPDWVSVPRSESRLSSFSSMSTSPYEHVNHSMLLSSSLSSSGPRNRSYDTSGLPAKVGRLQINDDTRGSESTPPPPPPRRQTGLGSGQATVGQGSPAMQKRKPVSKTAPAPPPVGPKPAAPTEEQSDQPKPKVAPPVAKKPAHLTATAPVSPASSMTGSVGSDATVHGFSDVPLTENPLVRRSTVAPTMTSNHGNGFKSDLSRSLASLQAQMSNNQGVRGPETRPLQALRRANTTAGAGVVQGGSKTAPAGGIPLPGLAPATAKPGVPIRKPVSPPLVHEEQKPPLPSRKPTAPIPVPGQSTAVAAAALARKKGPPPPPQPAQKSTPAVDLLGDDAASELSGWEALKPSSS